MKYKVTVSGIINILLLVFLSCAGSPGTGADLSGSSAQEDSGAFPEQYELPRELYNSDPSDLVFLPGGFPSLEIPSGVGVISQASAQASLPDDRERSALTDHYRWAYADYLLRDASLAGVLGGDQVHGWPDNDPYGWVQNWRSGSPADNSWGLPALILAIRGITEGRVFTVQGKVLDHYGKSAGRNNANGAQGYGSPRGYEFYYDENLAQRFDLGLISVSKEGRGSFIPEDPPSMEADPPSDIGFFTGNPAGISGSESAAIIRMAFLTAWKMALDRGYNILVSDGPGQYISFSDSFWNFPGGETLKGIYVQTFNRRSALLVLTDSSLLPPYPRFLSSPFIDVLLRSGEYSILGGNLEPLNIKSSGGDDFTRALIRGISLYGIPLTDPIPVKGSEDSASPWQVAQRFSRGWLVGPPAVTGP